MEEERKLKFVEGTVECAQSRVNTNGGEARLILKLNSFPKEFELKTPVRVNCGERVRIGYEEEEYETLTEGLYSVGHPLSLGVLNKRGAVLHETLFYEYYERG